MRWMRTAMMMIGGCVMIGTNGEPGTAPSPRRPHISIRGIYGGMPQELIDAGKTLNDYGVNAIWLGSGSVTVERVALIRQQEAKVFAEFNTMHDASYLKEHPDAAPVGVDGKVCPPPDGWQGLCPTHPGYRKHRMDAFRKVLRDFELDGIWLDYHHSHAAWEQAKPNLPDTCFCERCLAQFQREAKTTVGRPFLADTIERQNSSRSRLTDLHSRWIQWRCDVFTDWVREFRTIVDEVRPQALLGTFHCPWNENDFDGALKNKLAIDLKAQAKYLDVFSIMPYHARFGHHTDPAWISRQTAWLGKHLGIKPAPASPSSHTSLASPSHLTPLPKREGKRRIEIWPIVQLSDWGEHVPPSQVREVLDHGTRPPATGVMVFNWGGLRKQLENVEEMGKFYREIVK